MRYSELLDTLQNLIGYRPTQAELCRNLDIKQSAMANRAGRNSDFSLEELQKLERKYAVEIITSSNVSDNLTELNYFPNVFGSCGTGLTVFDETSEKISVTKDLITNYSPSNQYSVIVARGESNEPTVMNNDKLIVEHIRDNVIIDNQLYVFSYDGQIYVKRLIRNIDELVVISDNPDKNTYRTQYITKENINNVKILGKIIGLIRENV